MEAARYEEEQLKTSLANQLLGRLVDLDEAAEAELVPKLTTMAELKWDTYEGFRAGQRFMESLARWLQGFDQATRKRWLDFLLDRLVFISAAEVDHLIAVAYPDVIRPAVLERVAMASGISRHRKAQLVSTPAFKVELRRILVFALSDGARLDVLRRNSDLSHEQFIPQPAVPPTRRADLRKKLVTALQVHGGEADDFTFNHVLLVDDFYGSGTSLIDIVENADGTVSPDGKIAKFLKEAASLATADEDEPAVLDEGYSATILIYMASARAKRHIEDALQKAGLADRWRLEVIQVFDDTCEVTDADLLADCDVFWDPVLEDEHKACAARGYKDCALPIVLHHNAPNNSVSPLWADSTGRRREGYTSMERRALFPRYERHHSDRP
ncbi:phosphoribosyltransferase-like protein [Flexivirga oryzae]|uniref:PRTase-CE domain-containing protein n=1 Tax=Flexivirga oryzae TaxID=1794944 RepID=A0A839N8H1_9MICO|nr:hypothetical protein [Flexivirga oryzae]MBB2893089.1 hypothetical protein [Flexivirga oryzae]